MEEERSKDPPFLRAEGRCAPRQGRERDECAFFGGVQAFQTPGVLSEDVDLQESNSVLREPPGYLGSVLSESQGGCGEAALSKVSSSVRVYIIIPRSQGSEGV